MQSTSQRFHGTMHTWSGKGYGFIRRDDKQPDVFAHISDVMEFMGDQLEVGQRRLMQDAVPEAWKDGQTTALALSVALSAQSGHAIPWTVLRRAIDDAIKARWIELSTASGPWPCDITGASAVKLTPPLAPGGMGGPQPGGHIPKPKGVYISSAALEPSSLQDLMDVLPDVIKAAAGVPLQFQLQISLGDGQEVGSEIIQSINRLLDEVSTDLRLRL
jgi:cold shock CspA family protein